jgi:hypothetical protein
MPIEIRPNPYGLPPLTARASGGVRAGDDAPPHAGDFYHTPVDRLDYINWLDGRIAELQQAYLWWLDGAGEPPTPSPPPAYGQPSPREVLVGTAVLWNEAFGGGMPFDQWVSTVWRPFVTTVNEGNPYTNWTLLNTHWPDIQEKHRLIRSAADRAKKGNLPKVPDVGDPEGDNSMLGGLNKPGGAADKIGDGLKAVAWVFGGVAAVLLVREFKK